MDRPALGALRGVRLLVDRLADDVPEPAQRLLPDGNRDRSAGVLHLDPAGEPVGGVHRHRSHPVVSEMLLHLGDQRQRRAVLLGDLDLERSEDFRKSVREDGIDYDALDLDDGAGIGRHESPGTGRRLRGDASSARTRLPSRRILAEPGWSSMPERASRERSRPAATRSA